MRDVASDELLKGEFFYTLKEAQVSHRILAVPLQHPTPTRQPGLPTASPRDDYRDAKLAARLCYAPPAIQLGGSG